VVEFISQDPHKALREYFRVVLYIHASVVVLVGSVVVLHHARANKLREVNQTNKSNVRINKNMKQELRKRLRKMTRKLLEANSNQQQE
jgi:hypothetical protein